jgi:hypothetical protein
LLFDVDFDLGVAAVSAADWLESSAEDLLLDLDFDFDLDEPDVESSAV